MEDSEEKVCKEIKRVIFIFKNTLLFFVRTFRNKLKSFILLQLFYCYIYVQLFFSLLKNILAMLKNSTQIGLLTKLEFYGYKISPSFDLFCRISSIKLSFKVKEFFVLTRNFCYGRVLSIFLSFFCKRSLQIFVTS